MRVWQVVLLVDLALAVGLAWGWAEWGRPATRLAREVAVVRGGVSGGVEREFHGEGVVRAVVPDIGALVITHGPIAGYMPAMTMAFRAGAPGLADAVRVGDAVRFTLRGVPPDVAIVAVEKERAR